MLFVVCKNGKFNAFLALFDCNVMKIHLYLVVISILI